MAVRIPLDADPSGVAQALNTIRAEIRKTGQEAKKFQEIDWSKGGLGDLADDAKKLQDQYEQVLKSPMGSGMRQRIKASGQQGAAFWDTNFERMYMDKGRASSAQAKMFQQASRGTGYEGIGGGGGKGGGGGGFGGMMPGMGSMKSMLKFAGGLAGLGGIASMVAGGHGRAREDAISLDSFKRNINDTDTGFDTFRRNIREAGDGMGLLHGETIALVKSFAKGAAINDAKLIKEEAQGAIGFSRGMGWQPGQGVGMFAQARMLGLSGQGKGEQREFAAFIAEAIGSGNMWSRGDEVMGAILRFAERTEQITVSAPNLEEMAALQSSMHASGLPGLRGGAGEALLGKIDAGFRNPGMGEAGMTHAWRALGMGGKMDPFQLRYLMESGPFANRWDTFGGLHDKGVVGDALVMDGDPFQTGLDAVLKQFDLQYKDKNGKGQSLEKWDAIANYFGMSTHQAEALDGLDRQSFGGMGSMLNAANVDLTKVKGSAMRELVDLSKADEEKLKGLRGAYLGSDSGWSDKQKDRLSGLSGEGLRNEMARIIGEQGMVDSTGMKTLTAMTDVKNEITDMSDKLVPLTTDIAEYARYMLHQINKPNVMERMAEGVSLSGGMTGMRLIAENKMNEDFDRVDRENADIMKYGYIKGGEFDPDNKQIPKIVDYQEREEKIRIEAEMAPLFVPLIFPGGQKVTAVVTSKITAAKP